MGKEKHLKETMEFFKRTPVVTSRDITMMVKRRGYAYLMIHNLIKSGKIKQVVKGFYTIHEDPTVAVFCFKPSYIGLQDALSFHNLWEQESNVVVITSRKIRTGVRQVFGSNVILHNIKPRYLFGFQLMKYDDLYIPVSDLEKTLIDFVYFRENLDKDVLKRIRKIVDIQKIKKYLKYYPKKTRDSVMKILKM